MEVGVSYLTYFVITLEIHLELVIKTYQLL